MTSHCGRPLIVAMILGELRRTGPILWVMPHPASIVLSNFGLALFLVTDGMNAGQRFLQTGPTQLLVSVLLTSEAAVCLPVTTSSRSRLMISWA